MNRLDVLLVEDNRECRRFLENQLLEMGYTPIVWSGPKKEISRWIESIKPDMAFISGELEGDVTGIEIALNLRHNYGVPVILLVSNQFYLPKVRNAEASAILLKPLSKINFSIAMENVFANIKLAKQLRDERKLTSFGMIAKELVHEFSNILCIIRGYSEISLLNLPEDSNSRKDMDRIIRAADRGKDMIKHLFSNSRRELEC